MKGAVDQVVDVIVVVNGWSRERRRSRASNRLRLDLGIGEGRKRDVVVEVVVGVCRRGGCKALGGVTANMQDRVGKNLAAACLVTRGKNVTKRGQWSRFGCGGAAKSVLGGETEKASPVWRTFPNTAADGSRGHTEVGKNAIDTGLVGEISRI
jgi:hypothetical protein